MTTDIELSSGSKLKVTMAPFIKSKALFQAVMEEMKALELDPKAEVDVNFWKDFFCAGLSSKKIESTLMDCMDKVLYNDLRIDSKTWDTAEAREDYLETCMEVAKVNLLPFMKTLYAQFSAVMVMTKKSGPA